MQKLTSNNEKLSRREEEVTRAFANGETHQQIAERLCIAPSTVRTHLNTIYRKLDVSSKVELHKRLENTKPPPWHEQPALPDKPSIVVLPFINMSGDPEQEYFAEGIAEDIITALSRVQWLFVSARTSSFSYKGQVTDVKKIGRQLGVRYVLEGSVRRSDMRFRVTAQLVDANNGSHVWAERYDREISDIFDIQDEITHNVVASTTTQVIMNEGALFAHIEKLSLPVWALANRSWSLVYTLTEESLRQAKPLAEQAVALDPSSGRAYQALAAYYWHWGWMGYAEDQVANYNTGRKAAERAVRLNDYDEYSHWILGLFRMTDREYSRAIAELERAIEINPNCSVAHGSLSTILNIAGLPEKSIERNEIAIRANPLDPSIFHRFSGLALSHFLLTEYDAAIPWARKSIQYRSDWQLGHAFLVASLVELGQMREAATALGDYRKQCANASLDEIRVIPFKVPEHKERIVESLQKAGLNE